MPSTHIEGSERQRSSYKYFLTYRTRWSDNDQYNHINNSVYYHLFDSIVNTYLINHCGLSPATSSANTALTSSLSSNLIGLVATSYCNYYAPLSFPQVLELGLRVISLGNSSVEYEIGVFAEGEKKPSAVGGYTHIFVDRDTRRSVKEGMGPMCRDGLMMLLPMKGDDDDVVEAKSRL